MFIFYTVLISDFSSLISIKYDSKTVTQWLNLINGTALVASDQSRIIYWNICMCYPVSSCVMERCNFIKCHRRVQRGGSGGPDPPFSWTPPFHL